MGFHLYASEWLKAGQLVASQVDPFRPVAYYLFARSIELSLKSFLLIHRISLAELKSRQLGHDLTALLARASALGLPQLSDEQHIVMAKANEYYTEKVFEYFAMQEAVTGFQRMPELSLLGDLASQLVNDLRQPCLDASDDPL